MSEKKFYITTPIYYVNDMPHIGHMYTTVMADIFARYHRLCGEKVYFLTGTDEHGQKIEKSAAAQGIPPIKLADRVVERYRHLWELLEISNDDFIRTTEDRHREAVQKIIGRIRENGDLYRGDYEGWYCAGAESFVPDSQVEDGRDLESGYPVERLSEPSWFFRLSAFEDRLLEWYRENPDCIQPRSRYNEVLRFVEGGLKDLSVSRVSVNWGIPFPGEEEHVVYVWLDALTNYISALGFGSSDPSKFEEFWPADLHLVGKDILRFHCVYWPAFLMAAGLPLPKTIFGHGWWMRDDAKMSKSLGNVVRPDYLIEKFGADPLRYFMAREMAFGQDSSFSDQGFLERFNSDLANALGNTASRSLSMAERFLGGEIPSTIPDNAISSVALETVELYRKNMSGLEPNRALEAVWKLLSEINGFIQEAQPWALARKGEEGRAALEECLGTAIEGLRFVSIMIQPFMPSTAEKLRIQLGVGELPMDLETGTRWGLSAGRRLGKTEALFPRIDIARTMKAFASGGEKKQPQPKPTESEESAMITIDDFAKIQLKVGTIREAEAVPKSKKLIRLQVDLGEEELRQVVAGIGDAYSAEDLPGRQVIIVANLKPAKLMGVESRGMLLAASLEGKAVLLAPGTEIPPGTGVR